MTFAFLSISYLTLIIILVFMPKRIILQEAYMAFVVVSLHTLAADLLFADIFDFYDIMQKDGPQMVDLFTQMTLPALFGIIFVNFIPSNKKKYILYIIFWVIFSVIFEQTSRYFNYIGYKGWKVWYSFPFYFYACSFMLWHSWFIRKAIGKE